MNNKNKTLKNFNIIKSIPNDIKIIFVSDYE